MMVAFLLAPDFLVNLPVVLLGEQEDCFVHGMTQLFRVDPTVNGLLYCT